MARTCDQQRREHLIWKTLVNDAGSRAREVSKIGEVSLLSTCYVLVEIVHDPRPSGLWKTMTNEMAKGDAHDRCILAGPARETPNGSKPRLKCSIEPLLIPQPWLSGK